MKAAANILVALTTIACLTALAISVYPGVLQDLLHFMIFFSCLIVPILGIGALVGLVVLARKGKFHGRETPWTQAAILFGFLFSTYVLLKLYVPRRIAFAAARPAFEQLVRQATPSKSRGTPLNRRLGVYKVDEYAADSRGGVYFRVYSGPDGIGPDRMSYGFAYKPNQAGTPFGASGYEVSPLGNDWYWFCASDDWY